MLQICSEMLYFGLDNKFDGRIEAYKNKQGEVG
jgi:hypothetical protein